MHRNKGIEWCQNPDGSLGWVWNPITGCLNGCPYCYARKLADTRLEKLYLSNNNVAPLPHEEIGLVRGDPFYPRFWPERLTELTPFNHELKPRGIFTCDMSDLFGKYVRGEWIEQVMKVIKDHPEHRFYLLTKQPQSLADYSPFPDNCWVGVSVTNQEMFYEACYQLKNIKAKVKYLSFEPLLNFEPLPEVLTWSTWIQNWLWTGGISWVILGAQTKPTVMPKIEWVEEIVEACDKAKIPVFLKDSLEPLVRRFREETHAYVLIDYAATLLEARLRLRQEIPA